MDEFKKIISKEIPLVQSAFKKQNINVGSQVQDLIFQNRIAGKLLTVEDLSFKLGVSKKTIYGWIYRGLIKPIKVGPRLVRFEPKEVEQWISNQGDS